MVQSAMDAHYDTSEDDYHEGDTSYYDDHESETSDDIDDTEEPPVCLQFHHVECHGPADRTWDRQRGKEPSVSLVPTTRGTTSKVTAYCQKAGVQEWPHDCADNDAADGEEEYAPYMLAMDTEGNIAPQADRSSEYDDSSTRQSNADLCDQGGQCEPDGNNEANAKVNDDELARQVESSKTKKLQAKWYDGWDQDDRWDQDQQCSSKKIHECNKQAFRRYLGSIT